MANLYDDRHSFVIRIPAHIFHSRRRFSAIQHIFHVVFFQIRHSGHVRWVEIEKKKKKDDFSDIFFFFFIALSRTIERIFSR